MKKYEIHETELITGIRCPSCKQFAMLREKRSWHCGHCGSFDKKAHLSAVKDYAVLFGPDITNQQLRQFLHLPSIYTANRLLKSMNLPYSGENKGRVYHLK